MEISIPESFRKTIQLTFGADGDRWLAELPALCEFLVSGWNLKVDGEFKDLTFNFALPVRLENGEAAVLKLGPHKKGRAREANVLRAYNGVGAVRLMNSSDEQGALLISRAQPGSQLKDFLLATDDEEETTEIAAEVIEKLLANTTERNAHTHIATWGLGFEKYLRETDGAGAIPPELVERGDRLFQQLIRTSPSETLLHGDLHHFNILANGDEWLAIDPKGVWGDPTYEVGAFVRNPMPELLEFRDLEKRLQKRLRVLTDALGFDIERVWGWSYAQSILAAIWAARDEVTSARWLKVASALEKLEEDL